MKGQYNGTHMRVFKVFPKTVVEAASLTKEALRRLEWIDWYYSHQENVSLTCRYFGISRDTFYRWHKRFNKRNLRTLEDDTSNRRPQKLREMSTDSEILKRIYDIRKADTEKSKYQIHEELRREGITVAHNVIQKVINRHKELQNTQYVQKVRAHKKRSIARLKAAVELKDKHIGSLVQIDTKHLYVLGKRFYVFVAIDCASRYALFRGYRHASSQAAADFLNEVVQTFPFSIKAVNTDNGSEYLLNFHKACQSLNLTHYFSHPHTPKMNSRAERLIRTIQYEYFNHADDLIPELDSVQDYCIRFNEHYNTTRFHQALHYKTPCERVVELTDILNGGTVRYV